jgi:hypothetical protein
MSRKKDLWFYENIMREAEQKGWIEVSFERGRMRVKMTDKGRKEFHEQEFRKPMRDHIA